MRAAHILVRIGDTSRRPHVAATCHETNPQISPSVCVRAPLWFVQVKTEAAADELLGRLEGGADFGELAMVESECPSKQQGGDLGWFGPGQMVSVGVWLAWGLRSGGPGNSWLMDARPLSHTLTRRSVFDELGAGVRAGLPRQRAGRACEGPDAIRVAHRPGTNST